MSNLPDFTFEATVVTMSNAYAQKRFPYNTQQSISTAQAVRDFVLENTDELYKTLGEYLSRQEKEAS